MEMLGSFLLVTLVVCGLLTLVRIPFLIARYRCTVAPKPKPTPELSLHRQGRDSWLILQRSTQEMFGPFTFRQANALLSWMRAGAADMRTREQVLQDASR